MARRIKHLEISRHYHGLIRSGVYPPGSRLPSEAAIAEEFGVSRITVIQALNTLEEQGLILKKRGSGSYVREPAANPDPLRTVVLIMPITGLGREIELVAGIEDPLRRAGYHLIIKNTHEDCADEAELIAELRNRTSGMILYPANCDNNRAIYEELMQDQWPVVYVDRYPLRLPSSYAACDNEDGGYQIGKYFHEHGHRSIAVVYHDITRLTSERDRISGFMRAMNEARISSRDLSILSVDRQAAPASLQHVLERLFLKKAIGNPRPTALFAINDAMALNILSELRKNPQLDVPANFLLGGFDDLQHVNPAYPFITIHQDYLRIGQSAAELLLEWMESTAFHNRQIIVPVELVAYSAVKPR